MKKLWGVFRDWLLTAFGAERQARPDEIMFALPSRDPRDVHVTFYADRSLFADLRGFGHRQSGRVMRASIKLGLGLFAERPELMLALDKRGSQETHVTMLVDEATSALLEPYRSQGQLSRFLRASAEVGLPLP